MTEITEYIEQHMDLSPCLDKYIKKYKEYKKDWIDKILFWKDKNFNIKVKKDKMYEIPLIPIDNEYGPTSIRNIKTTVYNVFDDEKNILTITEEVDMGWRISKNIYTIRENYR